MKSTPKEQGFRLQGLRVENLHQLFGFLLHGRCILHPAPPPLVYSVLYICQCGLVDNYFIPWVIIQHYFVQMIAALAIGSFAVGSCVPLAHSHVSLGSPVLSSGTAGSLRLLLCACHCFAPSGAVTGHMLRGLSTHDWLRLS